MGKSGTNTSGAKAKIASLLPGFHCGACGEKRCDGFVGKLLSGESDIDSCPHLRREQFTENRAELEKLIAEGPEPCASDEITGLIDGYTADIALHPLPGESSCREILFPFARTQLKVGDIIKYRPLGCPIVHFAKVLDEAYGLVTVHMVGPGGRTEGLDFEFMEIGVCMVGGFEGTFTGKPPFVGQTVRFLPHHCMMGKVHSGVVVQVIGNRIIIEGIDLKVWAPPI